MTALRRLSYVALAVAFLHVVFGAIVRISGSGMGCGVHWPKCYGYWFPPFSRPDLVIEVLHRYFAALLIGVVLALAVVAALRRREPRAAGRGGVLRAAGLALGLVIVAAAFGAVTVRFANAPWATVTHKAIAASLLAALAAAAIRAGGLGAAAASAPTAPGTRRAVYGAAALAIVAVLLGGLTAKVAGGAVACQGFPLCGEGSSGGGAQHVQLTHRVVAYLLAFHLLGLAVAVGRRRESGPVAAAARLAAGVVVVQIALGAAMVLGGFYPVVRSLHQATGITLWLTTFVMAYLARRGGGAGMPTPAGERPAPPRPAPPQSRPVSRAGGGSPVVTSLHTRAARRAGSPLPAASGGGGVVGGGVGSRAVPVAGADGGVSRAHGPVDPRGRALTPARVRLAGAPEIVVQSQPLRRRTPRDARRGADDAPRPIRVVDGTARPSPPARPIANDGPPRIGVPAAWPVDGRGARP